MKFIKGVIIGSVFATPALYMYQLGHEGVCAALLLGALLGGMAVELEYI